MLLLTPTLLTLINYGACVCVYVHVCVFVTSVLNNIKLIISYSNTFNQSVSLSLSQLPFLYPFPSLSPPASLSLSPKQQTYIL